MIIYDTKKWTQTFIKIAYTFIYANNYKRLLKFIVVAVLYSFTVTLIFTKYLVVDFRLDPVFFSLIGVILSLILVFRLNTSYAKWWEGRIQWGLLVNSCRILASTFHALLPKEDKDDREYIARQISNYPYSLKGHLRNKVVFEELFYSGLSDENEIKNSIHIPQTIATRLFEKMESLCKNGTIDRIDKINLKPEIAKLTDILGACERIKNTPIPFSHSSYIKLFLIIYIVALPFGLMDSFFYFTVPVTALITFALFGAEIISEEIEEPFNGDPNDLPLSHLSGLIRKNVYATFALDIPAFNHSKETTVNGELTIVL